MLHTAKKFMHKLFGLYLIAWFTLVWLFSTASAQGTAWGNFLEDQQGLGGINVGGAKDGDIKSEGVIDIIKNFINWALGLLGLIALIMLLYGGYKMVVAGGDEAAYQEWLKILKNAAIGIAFIATSYFMVSFIFFVIGLVSTP